MSLKAKISFILLAVVACYAAVDYAIQIWGVYPSFLALEREEATKDMERCTEAIDREIHHLDKLCGDWSPWDDTYKFAQDHNKEYVESNLTPVTFKNDNLNLLYVYDAKGQVVWGQTCDLEGEEPRPIGIEGLMPAAAAKGHPLFNHPTILSAITGMVMTPRGPMLISSRPILTSHQEGPSAGTLIMGRFLGDSLVQAFVEQTRVSFQVWPIQSESIPEEAKNVPACLTAEQPVVIVERGRESLLVYRTLSDTEGKPILLVRARVPRQISAKGRGALRFAMASILTAGLVVLGVLYLLIQKTVVRPVSILTRHAIAIGASDDLTSRIGVSRRDEIGRLGREFNRMVERLAEARRILMEQSFRFGIAEMASGVLHNIRNAISPVNVQVANMRQALHKASLNQIEAARGELQGGKVTGQRKEDLRRFLDLAGERLLETARGIGQQLDALAEQTMQIERILDEQDRFSRAERPVETCELSEMLSAAVAMVPVELSNSISVYVDPLIAERRSFRSHRATLVQVLANVLVNAAESIHRAGAPHGEIHVQASQEKLDGTDVYHVRVRDNGQGIAPENLTRIFERGYSTKAKKSGVGLHWSFNSLAAMNGSIRAESPGPGQGATIHVLIPTSPAARSAAEQGVANAGQ
jgi:sensor domain CHASE-containing protein